MLFEGGIWLACLLINARGTLYHIRVMLYWRQFKEEVMLLS